MSCVMVLCSLTRQVRLHGKKEHIKGGLNTMDYAELGKGVKYFQGKWPPSQGNVKHKYAALRSKGDQYWLHLERLNEDQLMDEIIDGFLNTKAWNARIPTRDFKDWAEVKADLKEAVGQLPEYYAALGGFRMEDIDFQGGTTLKDGRAESNRSLINHIYSRFLQVKGFGPTAASKLMHMALPNLFVMCDRDIIQKYCIPVEKLLGVKGKPRSYIAFLILMQENTCHVIKSYPRASELAGPEVVQRIQAGHSNLSLPRLLDMANMAVRDCEQATCIGCMKKAKARWAELGLMPDSNSGE